MSTQDQAGQSELGLSIAEILEYVRSSDTNDRLDGLELWGYCGVCLRRGWRQTVRR